MKNSRSVRSILWVLVLTAVVLLAASCRHTSPFTEEHYFSALGESDELVITMDVDASLEILGQSTDAVLPDVLTDRSDRVSVAVDTAEAEDGPLVYYGAVEGDFGKLSTSTALCLSSDWQKGEDGSVSFYGNEASGMKLKIPKSGIVLFTNSDIQRVYDKTYAKRELFIPYEISEKMDAALAGIYIDDPEDISYITDQIPKTMVLSIDSAWIVLTGTSDDYRLAGVVKTKNRQASRVLGTLLRMNYLVKVRELTVALEDWQDDIQIDETGIMIDQMYMTDEEVIDILSQLLENIDF